jgi:hypothetical protein
MGVSWLGLNSWNWQGAARKALMGFLVVTTLAGFVSLMPTDTRECRNGTRSTYDTDYGYLWQVVTPGPATGNHRGDMSLEPMAPWEQYDAIGPALSCEAQNKHWPEIAF